MSGKRAHLLQLVRDRPDDECAYNINSCFLSILISRKGKEFSLNGISANFKLKSIGKGDLTHWPTVTWEASTQKQKIMFICISQTEQNISQHKIVNDKKDTSQNYFGDNALYTVHSGKISSVSCWQYPLVIMTVQSVWFKSLVVWKHNWRHGFALRNILKYV